MKTTFGLFGDDTYCLEIEVVIFLSVLWTDNLDIFVMFLADSFRVHLYSLYPLIDVLCDCVAQGLTSSSVEEIRILMAFFVKP